MEVSAEGIIEPAVECRPNHRLQQLNLVRPDLKRFRYCKDGCFGLDGYIVPRVQMEQTNIVFVCGDTSSDSYPGYVGVKHRPVKFPHKKFTLYHL